MATTTPIVRHATVRWVGSPPHGTARAQVDSHAFTALPVSVNRGSPTPGKTTPGELLAAAYATFLAARVARQLERDGDPAHELVVDVSCLISDWESITVAGFQVDVHGRVRGIDRNRFRSDVQADVRSCSQAFGLRDDVPVELHTSLGS